MKPVHQPVHQRVYHLYGGAIVDGHLFIDGARNINAPVYRSGVHRLSQPHDRHVDGHSKPAENSRLYRLSIIFLSNSKKRNRREKNATEKEYAREDRQWTGGFPRAFQSPHPEGAR